MVLHVLPCSRATRLVAVLLLHRFDDGHAEVDVGDTVIAFFIHLLSKCSSRSVTSLCAWFLLVFKHQQVLSVPMIINDSIVIVAFEIDKHHALSALSPHWDGSCRIRALGLRGRAVQTPWRSPGKSRITSLDTPQVRQSDSREKKGRSKTLKCSERLTKKSRNTKISMISNTKSHFGALKIWGPKGPKGPFYQQQLSPAFYESLSLSPAQRWYQSKGSGSLV